MITVYNKIEKSMENTSGFQVVPNYDSLERPFLLCLSPQNNLSKSIYGIMREGAQAARILTTQGVAGRFKLDEFPADILGVRFESDDQYQQAYTEIADKFLHPFLVQKGQRYDIVRKQARKINIFAYCDGVYTYKGIEERLETLLERDGYNADEIHGILSQISLTALESLVETGSLHATSAAFIDVNDKEIECDKTDSYRSLLGSEEQNSVFSPLGNSNGVLYIYRGNGIHKVKAFFKDESNIAKPAVCGVVSMFLENSLENSLGGELSEVSVNQIMAQIERFENEDVTPNELLDRLDEALVYNHAPRYSEETAQVKMELDSAYKLLRKTNQAFIHSLNYRQGQDLRLSSVIRGIHEFSSDVTFEQILTYAHMWQPKDGKDVLSLPSDKQVRLSIFSNDNIGKEVD